MVYLILFVFTIIVRFPYFFDYVIDWDESTFILMGQDIVNGNLPHTNLLDNKPPLAYLPYSLVILLFGKNIIAIRMLGSLCVFISSCIIWKIAKNQWNNLTAFIAALLLIIFASTIPSGQSTMTEHLVLIPLSLILYIIIENRKRFIDLIFLGVLTGCTVLIRTNLIYILAPLALLIIFDDFNTNYLSNFKNFIILCIGILIPVITVIIAYGIADNLAILYRSTVLIPIYYTSSENVYHSNFLFKSYYIIRNNFLSPNFLIWILAICGILISNLSTIPAKSKKLSSVGTLFLAFVLLSILHTGRDYGHYMIQLLPYFVLLASFPIYYIIYNNNRPLKAFSILFITISILFPLTKVTMEYNKIFMSKKTNGTYFHGTSYNVVNYLKNFDVSGKYVFF